MAFTATVDADDPLTYAFTGSSLGSISSAKIDPGDGSALISVTVTTGAFSATEHTYGRPGNYTASLITSAGIVAIAAVAPAAVARVRGLSPLPAASVSNPLAAPLLAQPVPDVGQAPRFAREDHVHPALVPARPIRSLIPAQHLVTYAAASSPKVAIIGDSTSTEAANSLYANETIWGQLKRELMRQNPTKTHTWGNYGIGGANFNHFNQTGTATGLTLPSWFTTAGNTWRSYVETFAPDLLFICCGINTANAAQAQYIRTFLQNVGGWAKVPDIVFITNKMSNPEYEPFADMRPYQLAMSTMVRSVALSQANGMGASNMPKLGVIDIGRYYMQMVEGFDPYDQYLTPDTDAVVTGVAAAASYTLPECDGDFDLEFVFPNRGSSLFTGGVTAVRVSLASYLSAGTPLSRAQFGYGGGNISTALWSESYQVTGTAVAAATNLTVRLICRDERVTVIVNGTTSLDAAVVKYQETYTPKIELVGSIPADTTMNITKYYPGRRRLTAPVLTYDDVWGTGTVNGNSINHLSSFGVNAIDAAVIGAQRFA